MTSGTNTQSVQVTNAEELWAALRAAEGGETIVLAAGDYGNLRIEAAKDGFGVFASTVTLVSANPDAPAAFSGLDLVGVEKMSFDGLTVDYEAPAGEVHWVPGVDIDGGADLAFRNMTFDGDLAEGVDAIQDGHGTGYGLVANGVDGLTVESSEFFDWHRGLVVGGCTDVAIVGNDIHSIRSDGMNFYNVQRVLIEGNYVHDFDAAEGSGDHGDMIQFATSNSSTPTTDVIIRGNVLDSGAGDETQSIFMRNEVVDKGLAGPEMYYQNVTIEENLIRNAHHHGITVGETNNLVIDNNTVLHNAATHDGSDVWVPKINVAGASTNVTIADNLAHAIDGSGEGWVVGGNLEIQRTDPDGANYYGDLFVNALEDIPGDMEALQAMPDSPIMTDGIGSSLNRFDYTPEELVATARTAELEGVRFGTAFDGTLTRDSGGFVDYTQALFTWDFGDGTTNTGMQQVHAYREPGTYTATLTVQHVDGSVDTTSVTVDIPDPLLIDGDVTAAGLLDGSTYNSDINSSRAASMVVADAERGHAVQLQTDRGFKIEREDLPQIFGHEAFTISMSLKADSGAASDGELFRIYSSMRSYIQSDGELVFSMVTEEGQRHTIETEGANLLDGSWHDLSLVFDGPGGVARAYVDGQVVGEIPASGSTQDMEWWDLTFGSSYSKDGFSGLLDDLRIHGEAVDPNAPFVYEAVALEPDPVPAAFLEPMPEAEPESAPEPLPELPEGSYTLGFEGELAESVQLKNGAAITTDATGDSAVSLDGVDDFVNVKGLEGLAASSQISFMLDFASGDIGTDRLVWSHMRYGLELDGENLSLHVGTAGGGFEEVSAGHVARGDGTWHRVGVALDDQADTLRVYLDGELAVERTDLDLDISGGTWRGMTLGGSFWGHRFGGQIDDFAIAEEVLPDSLLASRPEDQLIG